MQDRDTMGNLTLSLLPTSDVCISFLGDDGHAERLSTLRNILDCSSVVIERISTDNSGRSFIIKVPTSSKHFFFWCSEKSRLLGNELLDKMKNLLKKKPSLADLTGISDSRLECFVTHIRTYLVGSNTQVNNTALVSLTDSPSTTSLDLGETGKSSQSASLASKSSCGRILSPRSSSFKEGLPRNLVSLKNVAREKFRRKGEAGTFSSVDTFSVSSPSCTNISTLNQSFNTNIPEPIIDTHMFPLVIGLEVGLAEKTMDTPALNSTPPISPYYCWCSPVASTLQYTVAPSQMTPMSMAESFTLPPLASLLASSTPISSSSSSLLIPKPCLTLDEIPPFLPEPTVRLPISMSTSQQIPIFTPLMTDPIIHIPVIDICSSGQAYLVSAGPAMNVTIPPLHQARISPLIQETDSMVEKSARDTLQLLIGGSSQLPSVLANVAGNQNVLAPGSRGLYGGAMDDVNHAIANSIAAMGMVSLSEKSSDLVNLLGETVDSGGTCSSNDDSDLGAGKSQ
ncbi:hypothetical protein L1987_25096 [Smallanthus sonchifolius]|uniref:Uncharacterized protein n=1 Tax=Smallanthus sonchifolius TaxID=185202 RepID=A0ACB9IPY3_9ASTR|nr:hypothetical protein L1987_25096 [Smallanthus sonchifolius]